MFSIIRAADATRFVIVVDVSNSMDKEHRLDRVKQAAIRWTAHDVRNGNKVGVVSFREEIKEVLPMTLLDGDDARYEVISALDKLKTEGSGLCFVAAIRQGLEVIDVLMV